MGRITDDDVILVNFEELLPLLCRRSLPIRPESGTGAGFHVKTLTEQFAEPPFADRRRVPASRRGEGANSKVADKARRIRGSHASWRTPDNAGKQDESR